MFITHTRTKIYTLVRFFYYIALNIFPTGDTRGKPTLFSYVQKDQCGLVRPMRTN